MQADSDAYSVTPATGSPQYNDGARVGGLRSRFFTFLQRNRIALKWVGPFSQGFFPNPEHGAHGGANILQIRDNYVTPYLPTYKPHMSVVMAGTNNCAAIQSGSQTLSSAWSQYTSLLDTMFALQQAGYAPGGRIVVTDITPIQTGALGADAVDPFNAGLPAIWDAFDLVHPNNKLFRFSFYQAIGGIWNAAYYRDGTDTTHPNYLGYNLGIGDYAAPGAVGVAMLDAYDGTMTLRDYAPLLAAA
jgi:hypothetical protein